MRWACGALLVLVAGSVTAAEQSQLSGHNEPQLHDVFSESVPWLRVLGADGKASTTLAQPHQQLLTAHQAEADEGSTSVRDLPPWGGVVMVGSPLYPLSSRQPAPPKYFKFGGVEIRR